MNPQTFVELLQNERATAILRTGDAQAARPAMEAAVAGGFRVVEFTLTTPNAFALIKEFSQKPGLAVGAGTVLTIEDARNAVDAGACFLVSPVTDSNVINEGLRLGVTCMPGTYSPTEMWQAHQAGAQLQKLFPVTAGGPAHVRSVLGPMPFLRIVPTNGVDEHNAADYLSAGAVAVGFVAPLFDRELIAHRRFDQIEQRARTLLAACQRNV